MILDDLHWADVSSVRLLLHLVQRLRGEPVLVAGAYRDLEVGQAHPLMELLAGVVREPAGTRVPLAGLTEANVARFVELTVGDQPTPGLVATVFERTEGNPLYVVELVRLLLEAGELTGGDAPRLAVPPGVQHVIGRRLDRLSATCNEVLTTAAVLGRAFSEPELEVTGGLAGDALLLALEEAEAARVLAPAPESPGRFVFAHPLIRETLYNQILTSRRVRLHRRTGEALEAFYRANPEPHLAELAYHFLQAAPGGDAERAIAYARRAGDRFRSLFAYEEAARQYQTALHLDTAHAPAGTGQWVELLLALAEAEARAGEGAAGRDHFRVAAAAARLLAAQGDVARAAPLLARAALGFADERGIPGVIDAVRIGLLEEALTLLGDGDSETRALVLARLAVELSDADARERRAALSEEAVAVARRAGTPATLAATLNGRHYTLHQPDKLPERLAAIAEIVRLADAAGDREVALQGHYLRLLDMLEVGDYPAATAELEVHARIAAEVRQPFYLWRTTFLRATFALLTGDFAAAGGLAAEALAYTRRAQIANALQAFGVQTFVLRWHTGTLRDVEGAVAGFAAQYNAVPAWQAALALLYSDLGREADARAVFERLAVFTASGRPPAEDFAGLPQDEAWTTAVALLADVCAELGDARRAEALYRLLLPYEQRLIAVVGGAACLGAAARYLGLLAATCGRWPVAERHFEDALAISTRMHARPWLAYTERDFAVMLLRRDRSGAGDRARILLDSALATGGELGMPRLVAQCEALLGTGGAVGPIAPAPAASPAPPNGLSAREVEVLGLLAEGYTNREIAEALVLSSRTVDHHIAAI